MNKKKSRVYKAPVPAYRRVEKEIRDQIRAGRWESDAALPTRLALAREFRVGMSTIQQAVFNLLADGTLSEQGRVTRVAEAYREWKPVVRADFAWRVQPGMATVGIAAMMPGPNAESAGAEGVWVPTIVRAIERRLADEGGATHFFNRSLKNGGLVPLSQSVSVLREQGVEGIIVVLDDDAPSIASALHASEASRMPLVFITSGPLDLPVPHVFYDNRSAGFQAAQHLLRQGCRELLFLSPFTLAWVEERIAGVRAALNYAGLPPDGVTLLPLAPDIHPWVHDLGSENLGQAFARQCYEVGREFFQAASHPCGVIAANDRMAFAFARAAADCGKTLGEDVLLVGFDDLPEARSLELTSLRPPLEALGEEAARLLQAALRGEQTGGQVRLRSHLIPRRSTQPYHARKNRIGKGLDSSAIRL